MKCILNVVDLRMQVIFFNRGETKDVVAYGTLLVACAQNRDFESAIHYFEAMKHNSLSPDAEVFVCLLSACSQERLN